MTHWTSEITVEIVGEKVNKRRQHTIKFAKPFFFYSNHKGNGTTLTKVMPNVASSIKEHSLLFNTFQSSWSSEVDKDTYHMVKDRYMNVRRLNNGLSPNMNHTNRKSFKWKKSYWTTTIAYQLPKSELTLQALYVCETLVLFSCLESILYKSINQSNQSWSNFS